MSIDFIQDFTMQSVIDMGLQYANGLNIIKHKRKIGKKIIAGFMPPMELCFSTEQTVPFWLPRFTEFPFKGIFNAITATNKYFPLSRTVKLWKKFQRTTPKTNQSKKSINLSSFSQVFTGLKQTSEKANFYLDSCIQTRICYGAYLKYHQYFDLLIGGFDANNCLYFAKFYERIGRKKPLHYFQKPYGHQDTEHALELVIRELEDFFHLLEGMANESIDLGKVKEKMKLVNEVKEIASLILHRYFIKGYVPFHWPVSLMLHAAYTDYLSDLNFFHRKMRCLVRDIESNIKSGVIRNYKQENIPRILFVGGPGLDPLVAQAIENQGGCLLYLDLFPNERRHQLIDLAGDFVLKYAYYLLGKTNFTKGIEDSINFWLKQASLLDVEGIVFCETWGCRFVAPAFRLFNDRVREELGIPVVRVNFNELGENLGQISTRIEAFMELIK